jgi:hypothetical protein
VVVFKFTLCDDDGNEIEHELPSKFEVCGRCSGHGTHLNPSIGEHAYSAEEFAMEFDDEEAAEYFKRGGMYDVTCEDCGGQRVTEVVDESALTDEQRKLFDEFLEREEQNARWDREDEMTRRMESGGY